MVRCNDIDQPIGKEAKHLGDFLGSVARNGSLYCLSYKDWRLLKTKKKCKGYTRSSEDEIMELEEKMRRMERQPNQVNFSQL